MAFVLASGHAVAQPVATSPAAVPATPSASPAPPPSAIPPPSPVPPAQVADPDVQVWESLQKGQQFYRDNDYLHAREAFERSRTLATSRTPSIYYWLGLTDVQLERYADASRELKSFLASPSIDPRLAIEARAALEKCKAWLATQGILRVETTPPGAELRLDSTDRTAPLLGVTPFASDNAPLGDHLIRITLGGYEPVARIVSIAAGNVTALHVDLWQTPDFNAPVPARVPVSKRRWFWPVIASTILLSGFGLGLGVGLGIGLKKEPYPTVVFK